jgi:hypothetical protein|tara:strand:+ start:595 stop:996 length:402 start_codon:yes stop_codon:yes gene_type:complete
MTKLNTPVHREVTINGEDFIASLDPDGMNGTPEFTLRKKRHKWVDRVPMSDLADAQTALQRIPSRKVVEFEEPISIPVGKSLIKHLRLSVSEIKSKLTISPMDYKLKAEVIKAVDDLFDIDKESADATRTLNQ